MSPSLNAEREYQPSALETDHAASQLAFPPHGYVTKSGELLSAPVLDGGVLSPEAGDGFGNDLQFDIRR